MAWTATDYPEKIMMAVCAHYAWRYVGSDDLMALMMISVRGCYALAFTSLSVLVPTYAYGMA